MHTFTHIFSPFLTISLTVASARHYNSDLSIWLSVDPLADKYPGVSPYTYCANNPVRLVDPNGKQWVTKKDEEKANEMIGLAQQAIVKNTQLINMLKFCVPKSNAREFLINELEERNSYLSEGIKGLERMGNDPNLLFHFANSDKNTGGYVTWLQLTKNMIHFNIYGDKISTFWHESKHIQDWLSHIFDGRLGLIFGLITKDGTQVLGTERTEDATPEQYFQFKQEVEKSAFRSEFSFDPSDFFNGALKPAFLISHINGDMGIYDN